MPNLSLKPTAAAMTASQSSMSRERPLLLSVVFGLTVISNLLLSVSPPCRDENAPS
jgi:hypothetical protein